MADVPNRTQHESELAAALMVTFVARGGANPDWPMLEAESREKLSAALIIIYLLMLAGMEDEFEIDIEGDASVPRRPDPDDTVAKALATAYAGERASRVVANMTMNMRREYDQLRASLRGGQMTAEEFNARIEQLFSPARASTIAVTEITAAASAAEFRAAQISRAQGKQLVALWETERDARVCPICAPLDHLPDVSWQGRFPGGPPAHPNCRCFLSFVPESELVAP